MKIFAFGRQLTTCDARHIRKYRERRRKFIRKSHKLFIISNLFTFTPFTSKREFLEPGAPCEINIDGKTMEKVQQSLKAPSRFTFDVAADHIYLLLLKKDCYPRFIRSEHYKNLLANAIQPSQKKRSVFNNMQ
jgi:hypothetical protein